MVDDHVIRPSQTTLMQGRNILDGVVIFHEIVHEMHRNNMSGVVFKKAYDKVKWSFLQQTLRMKGFSEKWHEWVQTFISGGSVVIKVNDDLGLRQGDPLSRMLFNIVADMLAILIERAKQDR
mgnify:CR=1 FL=1